MEDGAGVPVSIRRIPIGERYTARYAGKELPMINRNHRSMYGVFDSTGKLLWWAGNRKSAQKQMDIEVAAGRIWT